MADNQNIRDDRDRSRVSGNEKYELGYVAKRFGISIEEIRAAVKQLGNSREKIEEYLQNKSNRS